MIIIILILDEVNHEDFLMETAYFVKVTDSMSWNQLNEKLEKLKRKGIKPLRFITVAKIVVSSKDFDNLAISIKKYNTLYAPYTTISQFRPIMVFGTVYW